jgi:hypothetical protein
MLRLTILVSLFLAACAGARHMASAPMMAGATAAVAPPPLDRSLFARDPNGQLSEDALQRIIASPIELDLPARVGVMAVSSANDWRGPGPDAGVPPGLSPLVDRLRRDASFSLVTQTMVIPSGSLGMEALRENAARYRLRYLILYREVIAKHTTLGPWAWGYVTGIGALFLPGKEQEVYGYIEASMFDVKTGLLMFTTRRSIAAHDTTNNWHTEEKLDRLASTALAKFAPDLAVDVLADLRRFATAAIAENEKRGTAAPIVTLPSVQNKTVAN